MLYKSTLTSLGMLAALCVAGAAAQEAALPAPIAISHGEATVDTFPSHVEFLLTFLLTGDTIEAALAATPPIEAALQEAIIPWDLQPNTLEMQGAFVSDLATNTVGTRARITFPMAGFRKPESGPKLFGKACDQVKMLAETFDALLDGPKLVLRDQEAVVRQGIREATENAYAAADAIALALNSTVFAVDQVKVIATEWNTPEESWQLLPNLTACTCTVRVAVEYILADRQ